ncbi:hypothetical protein NPIL_643521, partial [Nephila pilipes]
DVGEVIANEAFINDFGKTVLHHSTPDFSDHGDARTSFFIRISHPVFMVSNTGVGGKAIVCSSS